MEDHRVQLTAEEFDRLNSLYPASDGSALIGKRAEEIVKIHFRRRDPQCVFGVPDTGADLKVALSDGSAPLLIEVKGTASVGVAWQQLKVSHLPRAGCSGRKQLLDLPKDTAGVSP